MWFEIHRAIGAKLLGLDPLNPGAISSQTDAGGKQRGLNLVAVDGQTGLPPKASTAIIGQRQVSYGGLKTSVPVWHVQARGRRVVDVYPSISFEMVGFIFAPTRYIWKDDRIRKTGGKQAQVRVEFRDHKGMPGRRSSETKRTVTYGPAYHESREHPEPYNLIYEVRLWSKDHDSDHIYQRMILEALPARGFLQTVQQDGTPKTCEMYQQSVNSVDDPEPTAEDSERKEFSWVYTYAVETFLDNTEVTEINRTMTEREFTSEVL